MQEKLQPGGKCLYCDQTYSKQGISRHMSTHLTALENEAKHSVTGAWHIKVEANEMFLHLLVSANATFSTLDTFLRKIWLECCGHYSEFIRSNVEIPMRRKFDDVCKPKLKIRYQYDSGSTTHLDLVVMKRYQIDIPQKQLLLSRNEPLRLMCDICHKKPAVWICAVCNWNVDAFYCETCSKKHAKVCSDFADYAKMSVVNSPRMGTCGYGGGSIDKERDGVFVIQK